MKKLLLFVILGLLLISFASALTKQTIFFDGFETSTGTGINGFNTSIWGVERGGDNDEATIVTTGAITGTYSAYLDEGDEGDVAITTTSGRINLAGTQNCNLSFSLKRGSSPLGVTDDLYFDVYNGNSWTYGAVNIDGPTYVTSTASTYSINLSQYSSSANTQIRFDWEANTDNEAVYLDNINITCSVNEGPILSNLTIQQSLIAPEVTQTIFANSTFNGVSDSENNTLFFYCDDNNQPTITNNDCTGGTSSDSTYPYDLTCSFNSPSGSGNYTKYCRVYDGVNYSVVRNVTYEVDASTFTTTLVSIAGDNSSSYFDSEDDGITNVTLSGEAGMLCRWSSSDTSWSGMGNDCITNEAFATCSLTGFSEGFITMYISCKDSLGNEQGLSNNLDVFFYLDHTEPTTSDNHDANIHLPGYTVSLTELDNVDSDPTTLYCFSSNSCTPNLLIDNNAQIVYNTRGTNYLRYFSYDDAGKNQTTVNKTVQINSLPLFITAVDNSTIIKGGDWVNVNTTSSESDTGQSLSLYICNSSGATSSGCTGTELCNNTADANLSCSFPSETDSTTHVWYAYIFDSLGEAATANPITGFYFTDSSGPVITIISPANTTYPSVNVTAEISTSENVNWAAYSLDGDTNITMTNISATSFTSSLTNLPYGQHNITFYANDSYGNLGETSIRYFSVATPIDTTSPSLTISSPTNASYTNPSGTYVNISSDEALSWAGYTLNGGNLTNLTNASSTIWYVNLTSLTQESTNTVIVYGNDSSGNQGARTVIFYADTLAPRYSSVSAPSTNQSLPVNCSIFWNDTFALSNVLIGENSSGSFENHTISLTSNGTASYLIVGSKLANAGNYTCIFYATDIARNTNSTSTTFEVSDVAAPGITVTSPTNGGIYGTTSILLSLVTNESASSAWFNNGTANITMGNTSPTNWNYTFNGLNNNVYTVIFYANDTSGNLGVPQTKTFNITIGVDSVAPVITLNSIANASYKSLSGVTLDVTTNENVSWVNYSLNGSANVSMTNTSMLNWNSTLPTLNQESTNNLVVYANDTAGNIGSNSIIFYADTLAPRFTSLSAQSVNETQSTICSVDITDTFSLSSVKISENATIPGTFLNHTIDLSVTGNANYTISNLAKGNYECRFYATDAAGNADSTSTTFSVSDITPPILTINSPIAQNYSTSSILFSLTTNENVSSANYSLDNGLTNISLTGSSLNWGKTSSIADGSYTVKFYALDNSGNLGSASVAIVVDTSVNDLLAPVITIWSPLNGSYSLDGSIILNITSDEALSWAGYTDNNSSLTNLSEASSTNWNSSINLNEGTHNITFYANDTRTNPKNQGSKMFTIYVDKNNAAVDSFICNNSVNDSASLFCYANLSDAVGLDYAMLSYDFNGSFVNSSQIDLSGTSDTLSYTFGEGEYTPGTYSVKLYVYDLSGRVNDTESDSVQVLDDTNPSITSIVYSPNNSDALDPSTNVTINASVTEDYLIDSVEVYYRNGTEAWQNSAMTNTSLNNYNSTIEFGAGNWTFYVNATDAQGNTNISSNYTLEVADDISQIVTTNITSVKSFTYAQRSSANELGYIILNTTSDISLNYNVTIYGSSILSRFNLNNTLNQTENYSAINGTVVYIPLHVNLTGLTSNVYPYNILVVSEAGTEIFERNLNVQTSDGPYLVATVSQYSSSVTRGQTDVELIATVTNLGTADASGVLLTWSLPSVFTLTQGNLTRNLGSLPVGVSSTNTIKVSVSSSAVDSLVNITATATATNLSSLEDTKQITILNPLTVTTPGRTSGSGGGSGGSKSETVVYSKIIEIVRGESDSFNLEVKNKYSNSTMKDLKIVIDGFLSQYILISPRDISQINSGETKNFKVTLKVPSYKENYEEYTLKATITGAILSGTETRDYKEVQNIKLIIQEISREKANTSLTEAQLAVEEMQDFGFNVDEAKVLLSQAEEKLSQNRNKDSFDLSQKVISIKDNSFTTDNLIRRIAEALQNPKKSYLLLGNVIGSSITEAPLDNLLSGQILFGSEETKQLLQLAITAFERGDYALAEERAKSAQSTLILERKGNAIIFIYLYWKLILLATAVIIVSLILIYKLYKRYSITEKISDADKEENNLRKLLVSSQSSYLSGKVSGGEYHREMGQFQSKLGKLKQTRLRLRNERVKLLGAEELSKDLSSERKQVETEIKKIQSSFYTDKKIPEVEYKTEFNILNERLAEIEEEKITSEVMKKKKLSVIPGFKFVKLNEGKATTKSQVKEEKISSQIPGFKRVKVEAEKAPHPVKSPVKYLKHKRQQKIFKSEAELKEKIARMLKQHGK